MAQDLKTLRNAVVERLKGIVALVSVEVLCEDRLNLVSEIQRALATAKGAVVVVSTGDVEGIDSNVFPPLGKIDLVVEVAETPLLNRAEGGANLPAIDMASIVAKALHHFAWTTNAVLIFSRMRNEVEGKTTVLYTLVFKTSVLLDAELG